MLTQPWLLDIWYVISDIYQGIDFYWLINSLLGQYVTILCRCTLSISLEDTIEIEDTSSLLTSKYIQH